MMKFRETLPVGKFCLEEDWWIFVPGSDPPERRSDRALLISCRGCTTALTELYAVNVPRLPKQVRISLDGSRPHRGERLGQDLRGWNRDTAVGLAYLCVPRSQVATLCMRERIPHYCVGECRRRVILRKVRTRALTQVTPPRVLPSDE